MVYEVLGCVGSAIITVVVLFVVFKDGFSNTKSYHYWSLLGTSLITVYCFSEGAIPVAILNTILCMAFVLKSVMIKRRSNTYYVN